MTTVPTRAISDVLHPHAQRLKASDLRALFAQDSARFDRFSVQAAGLLIDFSKEKIDADAWQALLALAEARGVAQARDAQLAGEPINATEGRAVLHTALRGGSWAPEQVRAEIDEEKQRFLAFAARVRSGDAASASGEPFTDVVNIGIGGSDLGPAMAVRALRPFCDGPTVHFIANVDGADAMDTLAALDPKRTLVLVASKTFTTLETLTNARTARAWLEVALGDAAGTHLAALSTNREATAAFGIGADRVFGFWDYVGGRYSVWSSIGLPVAIAIGPERFEAFLQGAHAIDAHFAAAPLEENLPVLLGLIGIWRRNAMGLTAHAVIPYEERLARFPAYLQQLDMESNGKSTMTDGRPVLDPTGMIVFGEPGTNAQHSFFQLCHQGSDIIAMDVLVGRRSVGELLPGRGAEHHRHLMANALAQTQALAFGRTEEEARAQMAADGADEQTIDRLAPHRTFAGDRPSTTLVYDQLDPETLGKLIALYEHKVFVESVIWGINAYDQWGVELGKALAKAVTPALSDTTRTEGLDSSTAGLVAYLSAPDA
ncbi:MAG: glucose-6-phosphate isomerase [Devosiaceae bacterium]|nr:glucose-6-phosphate isomerase [Devosiaceae bacterium MH13]